MTENHGVPGSNPGPATLVLWRFAGKARRTKKSPGDVPGLFDTNLTPTR
jgi:hypothetical protein